MDKKEAEKQQKLKQQEAERCKREEEERQRQQRAEQDRIRELRREEERQRQIMGPNPQDQYQFRIARWRRISAETAAMPPPPRYSASAINPVDRLYQGWRSESDSE